MTIKEQAFAGIRWNTLSKGIRAVGGILQLYILVRYLEASDFGLMAMVNVFLFFIFNFLDFGFNNGIIHREDISNRQLSSLYWFTVLLGIFLGFLFFLGGPLVAWFYQEPRLIELIQILSIVFVISALGNQFKTLLIKHLRFNTIAFIDITSFLIGFFVIVFLAIKGYGVYALVYGALVKAGIETLLSIGWGRRLYHLQLVFQLQEVRFFLNFGLYQMGERLLTFFNEQFDVIIIGKLLGPDVLGIYDVLKRFLLRPMDLINPIITGVSFPVMSRLQQEEKKLGTIYLRQLNYICSLNFPIYLLLFFNAEAIIVLMFGESWLEYVWIFRMYLLVAMSYCTGNPVGTLILAKGRPEMGFYWNLALFFVIPVSVYWGTSFGLIGVVGALLLMQALLIFPNYLFLVKPLIPTNLREYFRNILLPLALAGVATGISTLIFSSFFASFTIQLLVVTIFAGLFYLPLCWLFNRPFILALKALL